LSRALRDESHLNVLAVDWSSIQEEGAARRDVQRTKKKSKRSAQDPQSIAPATDVGSLSYKKLVITAESLITATNEWIQEISRTDDHHNTHTLDEETGPRGRPVFLVGLHACGSLTLDILRAFVQQSRLEHSLQPLWCPAGVLVVGCCYNLLRTEGALSWLLSLVIYQLFPCRRLRVSNQAQPALLRESSTARCPDAVAVGANSCHTCRGGDGCPQGLLASVAICHVVS
jgi:hypothetical protein